MRAASVALLGVGLSIVGCGDDRPSHAAIDSIGLDAETSARLGAGWGGGDRNPGVESVEEYRKSLVDKLASTEARLRDQPAQARLEWSVRRLRDQLDALDSGHGVH